MAKCIRYCLPCRWLRVEGFIYPIKAIGFESPGDGKGLAQKTLRRRQQRESVPEKLPVVQQLRRAFDAPEAGDAESALWHLGLDLIGTAEQDSCGPQQHSVLEQLHAMKQFGGLPSPRILQPTPSDRFPDSLLDFGRVEVVHRPTGRRLVLPAALGVHSLEENPVVLFGRHLQCGVAHPSVGHPFVDVRFRRSGRRNHHDHLIAARDRDPLNRREDPRLNALDLSAHLLDRVVADLLSNHGSIGSDTEQDVSAALIEHRAQRLGRIAALSCRSLEFQRLRLACCGQL